MKELMSRSSLVWVVVLGAITVLLAGCVTRETYESQVKRATNLQRLLADEEKKRNSDVRKFRQQVRDLETQNLELEDRTRELDAQVAGLKDEEARMRDEVDFLQLQPTSVPGFEERTIEFDSMPPVESFEIPEASDSLDEEFLAATEQPVYHEVKSGDTLWGVAKRHDTNVNSLKELNGLTGDRIYVGQSLLVGYR